MSLDADKPDKGQFKGSCNRRVCQKPDARNFNTSTRAYYCDACGSLINAANYMACVPLVISINHPSHPHTTRVP